MLAHLHPQYLVNIFIEMLSHTTEVSNLFHLSLTRKVLLLNIEQLPLKPHLELFELLTNLIHDLPFSRDSLLTRTTVHAPTHTVNSKKEKYFVP